MNDASNITASATYPCDGCKCEVPPGDLRAMGRDADGAPDAPDLCRACRGVEGDDE